MPGRPTRPEPASSPWSSGRVDPDWRRIADAGARYYPTLIQRLAEAGEATTGYRRAGALSVAADEGELDHIEQAVRARVALAPEAGTVTRLSPAQARALFPPLHPDLAAVHVSGAARVDGRLLAVMLRWAAERCGASFRAGRAELLARDGRVTGIRLDAEAIEADCVVVAAGAWAPEVLKPVGERLTTSARNCDEQVWCFAAAHHEI